MSARACSDLDCISRSCCLSYDNVWEIKPGTPPVIFEDVYGNEITRYAKRDLGSRLRSLTHRIARIGDFSNGDTIRRQSIILDHYGGYVIPNNVSLGSRLIYFVFPKSPSL